MQENFDIFDFALTDTEMTQLKALDTGKSLFFSHHDPETVEWFMSIFYASGLHKRDTNFLQIDDQIT